MFMLQVDCSGAGHNKMLHHIFAKSLDQVQLPHGAYRLNAMHVGTNAVIARNYLIPQGAKSLYVSLLGVVVFE